MKGIKKEQKKVNQRREGTRAQSTHHKNITPLSKKKKRKGRGEGRESKGEEKNKHSNT